MLWICLGIFAAVPGFAGRPLVTEDTETVEKGSTEIEIGFDYLRDGNGDRYYTPSLQVEYGPWERIEVAVGMPYIFLHAQEASRVHGIGDAYAYLKYRVWEEGKKYPALTLKPLVKFPTASQSKGLGSGRSDFALTAAFSKSFPGIHIYSDATYTVFGEKHVNDQFSFGLAGEVEVGKGFNFVSEVRYGSNFNSTRKDDPATFLAGLQAEFAGAVFDAAVTVGLNHSAPDYIFSVGVTLKIP